MAKALVTGACGFVAPYLINSLIKKHWTVVGTYLQEPKVTISECSYKKLDICNFESTASLLTEVKPEVIFHLAGISFVPEAESNFEKTMAINVNGVFNLLRVLHLQARPVTFVFISSAEVYGDFDFLPITEEQIPKPRGVYGLSKLYAEQLVMQYHRKGVVKGVINRPFNHLGVGQDSRFMASNFAKQLAQIAKLKNPPVLKVGNLDALRDFSDVKDIVEGYILSCQYPGEIFNLCSGQPTQVLHILDTLIKISGCNITVEKDLTRLRPSEVPSIYGSNEKAKKILNWQSKYSLLDSLRELYRYWFDRV